MQEPAVGERRLERNQLIKNTLFNGIAQALTMLVALYFTPKLIQHFGQEQYALFILAASMPAYASLLDFGVGAALTQHIASYTGESDQTHPDYLKYAALVFYGFTGLIIAVGLVAVGLLAPSIFKINPTQANEFIKLMSITAIGQALFWPLSIYRHMLAGHRRYTVLSLNTLIGTIATGLAYWLAIERGYNVLELTLVTNFILLAVALLNVGCARRYRSYSEAKKGSKLYVTLRTLFMVSWPIFILQVVDVLFYQQTDSVVLGIFTGMEAITLYEGAGKFNAIVVMLSGMAVSAIMPFAARMHSTNDSQANRVLYVTGTKYLLGVLTPIIVFVSFFAEAILINWLGSDFKGQGLAAAILLGPHLLVILGLIGDSILMGMGRIQKRVPYAFMQAIVNVALSVLLVRHWGVLGVAIGTATAHLLDVPFHIRLLSRELEIGWRDILHGALQPAVVVVIPWIVAAGLFVRFIQLDSLRSVFLVILFLCVGYYASYALFALDRDERKYLFSMVLGRD